MEPMETVYQRYADQVKRFLVCLTGDAALAEELTQAGEEPAGAEEGLERITPYTVEVRGGPFLLLRFR